MAPTGPIIGILLAAGRGRRFGSDKLCHPLADGQPMAVAAARHLQPACDRLIAVLRPDSQALARELAALGCEPVFCPAADAGMGYSLASGIRAAPEAAAWIVALADMPFIAPSTHHRVAEALRAGHTVVTVDFHGQRGHPVGFSQVCGELLASLSGDQGGRRVIAAFAAQTLRVTVDDPGVIHDIDHPADLIRAGKLACD